MKVKYLSSSLLLSMLAMTAMAQEISVGAGALSTTMASKFSYYNDVRTTQVNGQQQALTGEIYAGYAYNVNKGFDLGAEFFYDLGGPEIEQNVVTPGYVKNAQKSTMGIRILPGFNITPSTRVFLGVGYAWLSTTINIADTVPVKTFTSTSATKKGTSLLYMAGLETMIYTSLGIRVSYSVLQASNAIASISSSTTYADGAHEKYKAKPTMGEFFLGGVFRFTFK